MWPLKPSGIIAFAAPLLPYALLLLLAVALLLPRRHQGESP